MPFSPLNWLMGLFSLDIGIDLGTAKTLVNVRGKGIVINEPSWVAIDKKSKRPVAIGEAAQDLDQPVEVEEGDEQEPEGTAQACPGVLILHGLPHARDEEQKHYPLAQQQQDQRKRQSYHHIRREVQR